MDKNAFFHLCELKEKPLKNNIPLGLKALSYTSINYAYLSIAYKLWNELKNVSTHF